MTIFEYMKLNLDDYCQCGEDRRWKDKPIQIGITRVYWECDNCDKMSYPAYENSLDAQQPVMLKLIYDGLYTHYQLAMQEEYRGDVYVAYSFHEFISYVAPPQTRYQAIMKALEKL